MYIWLGIDVDSQLEEIKRKSMVVEKQLRFSNSNFTLPLHISLKMSFSIDNSVLDEVVADMDDFFNQLKGFTIEIEQLQCLDNICWIKMKQNLLLNDIHDRLNALLKDKYGVPLHEYDCDYLFHTTLFMDSDVEKVTHAYNLVKDVDIPQSLVANRFVIGTSVSGKLGTFSIYKQYLK